MKNVNWKTFKVMWKLQFSNYKSDIVSIAYGWFITSFTMIVWLTFKDTNPESQISYDPFVLASALGVSTIRNCMYNMSRTLYDFRRRGVFDKTYSTPISKKIAVISTISFNQSMNLVVSVFLFGLAMLYSNQRSTLTNVNWPMFLIGYLFMVATCNLFAVITSNKVKSAEDATLVGNIFYYITSYLLGFTVPYTLLSENHLFLYLTYIIPQKYCLSIMQAGWIGSSDFTVVHAGKVMKNGFGYSNQAYIPYIASILLIIICIIIIALQLKRKYERGIRKYRKLRNRRETIYIINLIEKAESIENLNEINRIRKQKNAKNKVPK